MSILNLLKEKTADEKQNFLNSIRSKASSKLKNTDDNKILDVISIVDAFNSSLSINSLVEQSSCVPKQNIVLPTEILGQGVEQIPIQRFSVFALHDGRLREDETFLLQLPHVLCHRIFTHADRMADGFVTGVALVSLTILAPGQIDVERYLPVIQTDAEYLVGHHKIVFLCAALGPFLVTQFIPPVLL